MQSIKECQRMRCYQLMQAASVAATGVSGKGNTNTAAGQRLLLEQQ
jgi:hypothetical protein